MLHVTVINIIINWFSQFGMYKGMNSQQLYMNTKKPQNLSAIISWKSLVKIFINVLPNICLFFAQGQYFNWLTAKHNAFLQTCTLACKQSQMELECSQCNILTIIFPKYSCTTSLKRIKSWPKIIVMSFQLFY